MSFREIGREFALDCYQIAIEGTLVGLSLACFTSINPVAAITYIATKKFLGRTIQYFKLDRFEAFAKITLINVPALIALKSVGLAFSIKSTLILAIAPKVSSIILLGVLIIAQIFFGCKPEDSLKTSLVIINPRVTEEELEAFVNSIKDLKSMNQGRANI